MRILLVRPPRNKQSITLGELMFCEPIGLEMVYTVLKDAYQVQILDLMIEAEDALDERMKLFQPSTFSPLTPFPNLPMYQQYQDRIFVDIHDYESWNFGKVTIQPSRMSLRQYYGEVLKTTLYINFIRNSAGYLVRRFGWSTLFRLTNGACRVFRFIYG